MKKKTEIGYDEWQAALRAAESERADKVPPGWLSTRDLEKKFGIKDTRARELARILLDTQRVERRSFRIMTPRGIYPVPHYRLTRGAGHGAKRLSANSRRRMG